MPTLEQKIHPLLAKLTQEIADAVKADMLARLLDGPRTANGNTPRVVAKARKSDAKNIRPCVVPKCGKPSKGPRFRFACSDHRDMPKAKLGAFLLAARKKAS